MKEKKFCLTFFLLILFLSGFAQFTPGNIVVCRIGDGTTILSGNAAPVFLDEFSPNGALVQSIQLPTTVNGLNNYLTLPGTFPLQCGMISLSGDKQFLVIGGYNAPVGYADVRLTNASDIPRVIGVVNYDGIIKTTTALTDCNSFGSIVSIASTNGNDFWTVGSGQVGGTGGIRYTTTGSTTSIRINTTSTSSLLRGINISQGQLYACNGASLFTVGSGLPVTSGQPLADFGNLPLTGIRNQFVLLDLDPGIQGVDVLYVADEFNGLEKYSLVGGVWVLNGTIGSDADDYRGLTAMNNGAGIITLFASRIGSNSSSFGGGELVKLTDASGYNGVFSGLPIVLASAPVDMASFRGIALAPQQAPSCLDPTSLFAFNITPSGADITWTAVAGAANYQYALTTSVTPPLSGTSINTTNYNAIGLAQGQTYYFHLRTDCGNFNTSPWATVSFIPTCSPPPIPSVTNNGYTANVKWSSIFGATGYEYGITTSATAPSSGTATADTSFVANNLSSVTQYYIHVRSNCGAGGYSVWSTKPFNTPCLNPIVTTSTTGDVKQFKWNKVNGAVNYEYALTTYRTPPLGGTNISDTAIQFSKLNSGTSYYFHVRTKCAEHGGQSIWTTTPFQTTGLDAYPNPVRNTLTIKLYDISTSSGVVLISDAMGRIVKRVSMTTNSIDVNVEDLAAGVYLVRYNDGTNKYMVKVLKQ